MANELIPPTPQKVGSGNQDKHLPTQERDAVPKSALLRYLGELAVAGAVATGIWVFGEHLVTHDHALIGGIINFLAFAIYLSTVPITALKLWPHPQRIWWGFIIFLCISGVVFALSSSNKSASSSGLNSETRFAAEVDDSIREAFFVFLLTDPNEFDDLRPFSGQLTVNKQSGPEMRSFTFTFEDAASPVVIPKQHAKKIGGFAMYSTSLRIDEEPTHPLRMIFETNRISSVCLLIPFAGTEKNPFKTIRDLNGASLSISSSSNILAKVKKVEFIVNGWELFGRDVRPSFWRGNGRDYTLLNDPSLPSASFVLDVHNKQFAFHQNLAGALPVGAGQLLFWEPKYFEKWQP